LQKSSIYISMHRTIKIKLQLSEADIQSLRETQKIVASCFNDHIAWSFEKKSTSKIVAHKDLYFAQRAKFPQLPSAMLQSTRDTALESVKALKFKFQPKKSENSGIRYDKRLFSLRGQQLTLSSINGRVKTIINFPEWCSKIVKEGKIKAVQLCWNKKQKQFAANIVFSLFDIRPKSDGTVIGLDRGLINLVTSSEGEIFGGTSVRQNQRKFLYLRKKLSAKGTHSAKRLLRKISGTEQRFSREVNHIIAKKLASRSEVKTYIIEDLTAIRRQKRGRKMNKLLHSWAFKQFESILTYKCEAAGISIEIVSAAYTSQMCSCCGNILRSNRQGGRYSCKKCGFTGHADINAACNIRDRWISRSAAALLKSSHSLNCEQDAVKHPYGNSVVLDVGSSTEFQGHGLVP
jgi:putative transposase